MIMLKSAFDIYNGTCVIVNTIIEDDMIMLRKQVHLCVFLVMMRPVTGMWSDLVYSRSEVQGVQWSVSASASLFVEMRR